MVHCKCKQGQQINDWSCKREGVQKEYAQHYTDDDPAFKCINNIACKFV